jgi:hypothetical protein
LLIISFWLSINTAKKQKNMIKHQKELKNTLTALVTKQQNAGET